MVLRIDSAPEEIWKSKRSAWQKNVRSKGLLNGSEIGYRLSREYQLVEGPLISKHCLSNTACEPSSLLTWTFEVSSQYFFIQIAIIDIQSMKSLTYNIQI